MTEEFEASRSQEVQAFYERMPYPAPLTNLDQERDLFADPQRRRAHFHVTWPNTPWREDLDILVAGCGTSQAARYALREPNAKITAIDVSETSLRHTRDLQKKYELDNLELHQLPIESVNELGRTFDLIVCTGVLHHLPDPDLGLRSLRDALRPQGAMRLMVYARYGRAGIYMMQEYCRLLNIGVSEEDLWSLGNTLGALPADHPIAGTLRQAKDFKKPEAMADALLHPQDRAYSVPELYAWLDRCRMSFGRWVEQAPYLAQCGMVSRSPHAGRLAALPLRQQYAAVELFRGTMVAHNIIAYRNDLAPQNYSIAFSDDRWRDYVPVMLPWVLCVRERLPPGSAAVLINGAHKFPDLVCLVDPHEDRLLAAIDGKRTLSEIMNSVVQDKDAEWRALKFFERLWQYDDVVFDASLARTDSLQ